MAEEKKETPRFVDTARENIYANFKQDNPEPEVKAKTPPEQTPVEPEKKEEPKPEPEAKKEEPKPEPKKEKTVPYEALSAERIKRKTEADGRKKAEERANRLEEELQKLKAQPQPEFQTEQDRQLYEMGLKLQAIEVLENERQKQDRAAEEKRVTDDIRQRLTRTDNELFTEGYPGFKHSIGAVQEYLREMINQGQDEEAQALDNPTGWKQIYRERIYPDLESQFQEAFKRRTTEKKIEAKKEAGLVTVPGKTEPKPKSDEELSDEEYRQKALAQRRSYQRA